MDRLAMKRPDLVSVGTKERATRLVGRSGDLARLAELEGRGERLVTIHGAAGMGKTRLAQEYMRLCDEEKLVAFVALSEARTAEDAGVALSEAHPGRPPVRAHFRERAIPSTSSSSSKTRSSTSARRSRG